MNSAASSSENYFLNAFLEKHLTKLGHHVLAWQKGGAGC